MNSGKVQKSQKLVEKSFSAGGFGFDWKRGTLSQTGKEWPRPHLDFPGQQARPGHSNR